jgi:dimethylargininase
VPSSHRALVRRPSPRLAEGLVTHIDRVPVDVELAGRQWSSYVSTLEACGWASIEVEPAPDCPDSVFVEDTVIVFKDTAVLTRPGAAERRPETSGARAALDGLGYRVVELPRGTLDGGDVLKVGDRVYVGRGGRTDGEGIAALRETLAPLGALVTGVPVTKALHLKSAVTALPDGTVIGYEPLVDDASVWPSFLAAPEESGAHVVVTGANAVLMAADAPRTAQLLRDRGLEVTEVDISEYEKLEGCVTCLSVRLRGMPPSAHR